MLRARPAIAICSNADTFTAAASHAYPRPGIQNPVNMQGPVCEDQQTMLMALFMACMSEVGWQAAGEDDYKRY